MQLLKSRRKKKMKQEALSQLTIVWRKKNLNEFELGQKRLSGKAVRQTVWHNKSLECRRRRCIKRS